MKLNFSNTKKAYIAITEAIDKQVPCDWLGHLSAPLLSDGFLSIVLSNESIVFRVEQDEFEKERVCKVLLELKLASYCKGKSSEAKRKVIERILQKP